MTGATGQNQFGAPVVATYGPTDPAAPLVVLLHSRGSNEHEILSLAPHLPDKVAYAARPQLAHDSRRSNVTSACEDARWTSR